MPRQISEELTRKEMIDPQLEKAGWYLRDHSKVKAEITDCSTGLGRQMPGMKYLHIWRDGVQGWFAEKEAEEVSELVKRTVISLRRQE
jgi:hypothetical protein